MERRTFGTLGLVVGLLARCYVPLTLVVYGSRIIFIMIGLLLEKMQGGVVVEFRVTSEQ